MNVEFYLVATSTVIGLLIKAYDIFEKKRRWKRRQQKYTGLTQHTIKEIYNISIVHAQNVDNPSALSVEIIRSNINHNSYD